jgi:hypothetical protein
VAATLERLTLNLDKKKPRKAILEGRPHLVAKARILKEEVLNGSGGPGFYPHEENKKAVNAWNHMPIVIDHPDINGTPVSARTPDVLNSRKVGVVLNAEANDGDRSIDVECWFDEEMTKAVDKRVYAKVSNGEGLECSTGLFLNADTGTKGKFGEKPYDWVAREQNPDHLAALPDKVGALSIEMGGGIFANAEKEPEGHLLVQKRSAENALKAAGIEFVGNELSFNTITRFVSDILGRTYGEKGRYWDGYVSDVFSDHVIYSDGKGKMFRQNYSATDKGVELSGKPVEVTRTVSYQPVGNSAAGVTTEQKMDRTAKINSLIGNGYAEADRAWLEKLDDTALAGIKPVTNAAVTPPAPTPTPPPAITVPTANGGTAQITREQVLAVLGPEWVGVYNFGAQQLTAQRTMLINALKATGRCKYTDQYLNGLPVDHLQSLVELAGAAPTPGGAGPPVGNAGSPFVPGYVPGMNYPVPGFGPGGGQMHQYPNGYNASYLLNAGGVPVPAAGGDAGEEEPLDYPVLNGQPNKKAG